MARRLRVRLLDRAGSAWHAYGDETELPADRVIELSEEDAARFLRNRGAARSMEVIGWIEDEAADESRPPSRSETSRQVSLAITRPGEALF